MKKNVFVAIILLLQIVFFSYATKPSAELMSEEESKDEIMTETYVISRKGDTVSVLCGEKEISTFSKINPKDPTQVLAAFFASFLSGHKEWKDFVAVRGIYGEKEDLIQGMNEDYKEFYSVPESISITIDGKKFDAQKDYFTIKIGYTYQGESGEDEDQVSMTQDERGCWFILELPR